MLLMRASTSSFSSLLFLAHTDMFGTYCTYWAFACDFINMCVTYLVLTSSLVLILEMANLGKQENTSIF